MTRLQAFTRPPDFVVQAPNGEVYLNRWHLIPKNRWFNIYLHHFLRSDDDRALHDHPWWNASILLTGEYTEITPGPDEECYYCAGTGTANYFTTAPPVACSRCDGGRLERRTYIRTSRKAWRPWAPWRVTVRRPETLHRVELVASWATETFYRETPIWTLFITGPRLREWGFDCPHGWRSSEDYLTVTPGGNKIGKGCE